MSRHRILALSFGAIGVTALPVHFLFTGSVFWIVLQNIVWVLHGGLLFYILKKKNKVVKSKREKKAVYLPVHSDPPGLLLEASPKYNDANADNVLYEELYEKLLLYFRTEKPYLQTGINLADVANRLISNRTFLSRLLNEKLNQNFNQFVNSFRVKEAQLLVTNEGPIALQELCKKVGFTSMASFTVAFKLNTGMTPGEWCKKQKRLS